MTSGEVAIIAGATKYTISADHDPEARPDGLKDAFGESAAGQGVLSKYVGPAAGSTDAYSGPYGPRRLGRRIETTRFLLPTP
jgi:hypothetical protein